MLVSRAGRFGPPEVRRGFIPPQLRGKLEKDHDLAAGYLQEASLGMVVSASLSGQPITLTGMHPAEPTVTFTIPPRRRSKSSRRRAAAPPPLLTNLMIFPAERKFTAVYCAKTKGLPRVLIPGIHKSIPISARINRDTPIRYQSPPTIHDRLLARRRPLRDVGTNGGYCHAVEQPETSRYAGHD